MGKSTDTIFQYERKRQSLLRKLAKIGPFISGTPVYLHIRCGNSRCKCVKDPEYHKEKLYISWTEGGKKRNGCLYIPRDLEEKVLKWIEEYKLLKEKIHEIIILGRKIIKTYVKEKRRCKGKEWRITIR